MISPLLRGGSSENFLIPQYMWGLFTSGWWYHKLFPARASFRHCFPYFLVIIYPQACASQYWTKDSWRSPQKISWVSACAVEIPPLCYSVLQILSPWSVFWHQSSDPLWTPAGYSTIQFSSDTKYLELLNSPGLRLNPTRWPSLQRPVASIRSPIFLTEQL